MSSHAVDTSSFGPGFGGEVIGPDDPAYDEARRVWNASIDKRPALVVRPAGVDDVRAAVRFARERGLLVAVRGGAHSVAGHGTCDGGIVIDLSRLREVRVDPERRRAWVGGGAVWGDVDPVTQEHGLAVPGGLISSTGVGGLTLGGGIGWLQRGFGLTCDHLVDAEVVTADGEVVRAADDEELLWGLRGGGGNFGIVTSFEFALRPVGPQVVSGMLAFPGERATDFLRLFRDYLPESPKELGVAFVLRLAPPAPFIDPDRHGKPMVAVAGIYGGSVEDGERAWAPFKSFGEPIADLLAARPYVEMQSMLDAPWGPGAQNYWKSEYLAGLPDEAIEVLVEHLATITSPMSDFKAPFLGGAIAEVGEDDTAYSRREAPYILNINARWMDPAETDRHVAWTRGLWDAMQPFSSGSTYTNFMDRDDVGRVADAFGSEKYARLVALKRRYDPDNVFRVNQNIPPDAA
jgi:FAD/FMN-containing dehydrogenase